MGAPRSHTADHLRVAYDVTRWQRYLYDARAAADGALSAARDAVVRAATHDEDGELRGDATRERAAEADALSAEAFARPYDDPRPLDADAHAAPWVRKAHEILDALPEWEALRRDVAGDPDFSALAAADVLQAVAAKVPDILRASEEDALPEGERPQRAPGTPSPEDLVRAALRRAVRAAAQGVADGKAALAGLAPGLAHVPPAHEQADPARMRLAEQVQRDPRLRDVLERAGRLGRIADRRKRVRSAHAREEVVDVERGADLPRVLPSQLAGLRGPRGLRLLTLRGIAERTPVPHRLEGTEPLGRGPVVVLLDESGSMSGDPHLWARAVGVACVGVAARERRAVTVIGFDARIRSVVRLDAAGAGWQIPVRDGAVRGDPDSAFGTPVPIGNGGGVAGVALHVARQGCPGGTDFGPALRAALALGGLLDQDRADLVFVTDGCAGADDATMAALAEAREQRGLRVHGLTVNGGSASPAMLAICDDIVDIDRAAAASRDQEVASAIP